jgi:predicted dehydrogenase/RimJ/RimL family protein N-acetyltransferase
MAGDRVLKVGLVGAAGRGGNFAGSFAANGARIHAVCDIREDRLPECAARLGTEQTYADYDEMLEKSDLDAVFIGTPMPLHVPQSVKALERGLHVLCEVPAAVSIEECRSLVSACRRSKALYMMSENYCYARMCAVLRELARQGLFGELFYAEGEYLHELKQMNEDTPWRRKWQTGIDGITYGTHSLGPILQWMGGDRVARVCCTGAGHHYRDPRGESYHEESPVMLCKTERGALIKVRVDMLSDRPHAMGNMQLQGTDGAFESGRGGPCDRSKIWLRSLSRQVRWHDFEELAEIDEFAARYVPDYWRESSEQARRAGHGGGDYFIVRDFVRSIRGEIDCPIGIHQAMDMTLPGLVSQQSILRGGAWMDVPDSRKWTDEPPYQQLHMVWPKDALDMPPAPRLPDGYLLRQWRPDEVGEYIELMDMAGFTGWSEERVNNTARNLLPDGFFVIEHKASGRLVATAQAAHRPTGLHPFGGELGWVAGDPAHKGKGLGTAVCAAVTARLIGAGYKEIYLSTDDWRLPAIKVYLKLGYVPMLYAEDMKARWQAVCGKLGWPAP